jgi:hypothetical protein
VSHHRIALIVIAATLLLDAVVAITYSWLAHIPVLPPARGAKDGLDWAVATMVTTGDSAVIPFTRAEHWLSLVAHLSIIPLGAASISFFTSGLTAVHAREVKDEIASAKQEIKDHVTDQVCPLALPAEHVVADEGGGVQRGGEDHG